MSTVDDLVAAIKTVQSTLDSAINECASAGGVADDGQDLAAQVGSQSAADGFSAVKDLVEQMSQQIAAARNTGDSALNAAEAIRSGG